jgi:hypothetical protein
MSRPTVGVGLAILTALAILGLLQLEAWLVVTGERKLAAGASALAAAAAIGLLLFLTLLAGRLAQWLRDAGPWARRRGPDPAANPPAPDAPGAGDPGRRP